MSLPVLERPTDPVFTGAFGAIGNPLTYGEQRTPAVASGDAINRMSGPGGNAYPPSFSLPGAFGFPGGDQLGALLQTIMRWIQNLLGGNSFGDSEQYFTNASGASAGDPHLSFNGATWDNMNAQPDLLHSDSFPGGFQLSTQTTTPSANGVTYNQSATVTTNGGGTSVTLDKDGNATICQNGSTFSIPNGASYDLGNGQLVQRNGDGSLVLTNVNGDGGAIATTLRGNGQGVDVSVNANNVDLGGFLAAHGSSGGGTLAPMAHLRRGSA